MTRKECVFQGCKKASLPDGKVCREHKEFVERIKMELEEDPMLIYNQRSDNPNRELIDKDSGKRKKSRGKSAPVCCVPGCFEHRVPPDPYCLEHRDFAGGD